jgi:hypothetical protein
MADFEGLDDFEIPSFPISIREVHIISPSHVTQELPIALLSAIRFIHSRPEQIHCTNHIDYDTEEILYIIICPAGLATNYDVKVPKYFITYQLEPTPILDRKPYQRTLAKAIYNWDYSRKNVKYLREHTTVKSMYVPLGYTPYISAIEVATGKYIYNDIHKDIDVLFLGHDAYERRRTIKEQLIKAGLNVLFICNLQLPGMQDRIRRAKICINIHNCVACLESVRLNILLANQACIVNEALDDDEVAVYGNNMITVPYEDLVSTCVDLIKQPQRRKRLALDSFFWYRREREWPRIVDFNELLPSLE